MNTNAILRETAASMLRVLGDEFMVTWNVSEHRKGSGITMYWTLGVYEVSPHNQVACWLHDGPGGPAKLEAIALKWLEVGESLSDIGAPLCMDCWEEHDRMRVATEEHSGRDYCTDCLSDYGERQQEASDADYYGGSGPSDQDRFEAARDSGRRL